MEISILQALPSLYYNNVQSEFFHFSCELYLWETVADRNLQTNQDDKRISIRQTDAEWKSLRTKGSCRRKKNEVGVLFDHAHSFSESQYCNP